MSVKANKSVTIDADLFNDILDLLGQIAESGTSDGVIAVRSALERTITIDDDCIDGDGSAWCDTHGQWIEYYVDERGQLLVRGTFDPEETGFPVCPDSQKYDGNLAAAYHR